MKYSLRHLPWIPPCLMIPLLLITGGCASGPSGEVEPPSLMVELIGERLELAREVARYKYEHDLPVRDPAREAELLGVLREQALARGLDPDWVERFFTGQMVASRAVQEESIAAWRSRPESVPETVPDLNQEIRPQLDLISSALLREMADPDVMATLRGSEADDYLASLGFSRQVRRLALLRN